MPIEHFGLKKCSDNRGSSFQRPFLDELGNSFMAGRGRLVPNWDACGIVDYPARRAKATIVAPDGSPAAMAASSSVVERSSAGGAIAALAIS
jgi:hypothetical protein